jgi:hypothetical protein
MEVLFKTKHGSLLYGLAHADSDEDWFTVVTKKDGTTNHTRKRYATHVIVDGQDSVVVDFGTWLVGCVSGVPQFCEAMMSQEPVVDKIAEFRANYVFGAGVYEKYMRTIKSFALSEDEGIKKRRHALRLALNLQSIGRYGKFNPRLSQSDIDYITRMAHKSHEDVYGLAMCLAYDV